MKKIFLVLGLAACTGACKNNEKQLISASFIDSLTTHYTPPVIAVQNDKERVFWKDRINPASPGFLNESRYAGCLALQFRLFGDIDSLKKADSILRKVDCDYNHKEAAPNLALSALSITRHRFPEADSLLGKARQLGLRPHESILAAFDVDFELGRYTQARAELNAIRPAADFDYYFRRSKMDHWAGELDSSINAMMKAAALTGSSDYLRGVALANAGDLYVHAGRLHDARDAYVECIRLNSADFHSIMGLGHIALVHDHNPALAENIFRWVQTRTHIPDVLFRLAQTAAERHDTALQIHYARAFARQANDTAYGMMYDKYLIQLYTGILHDPALAESIARKELNNRATPLTYAWYAWTLLANHKKDQAWLVYQQYVSGKPLEALELYWMGRLMEELGKNYNAGEFYKAANETRYDLDPADAAYIQTYSNR